MALRFFGLRKGLSMQEIQDEMKQEYRACDDNAVLCEQIKAKLIDKRVVPPTGSLDELKDGAWISKADVLAAVQTAITGDPSTEPTPAILASVNNLFFHCASCDVDSKEFADRVMAATVKLGKETTPLIPAPQDTSPDDAPPFSMHPLFGNNKNAGSVDGTPMLIPERLSWPQLKQLFKDYDRKFANPVQIMRKHYVKLQRQVFASTPNDRRRDLVSAERLASEQEQTAQHENAIACARLAASMATMP